MRLAAVACVAATVAGAGASEAGARAKVWRVTGYSFRYEQATQPSHRVCDPQFSYPTGFDQRSETATVTMTGLKAARIPSHGGGPMTRIDPFGGATTLARTITKRLVNCTDGSMAAAGGCGDSRPISFGAQEQFTTGSFRFSTNRARRLVRVRVTGFGFEPEILECASDPEPGFFLGPPVALNRPVLLRATLPLRVFAHRTATIRLTRSIGPPSDAAARGIPLGSAKISFRIALKRSAAN